MTPVERRVTRQEGPPPRSGRPGAPRWRSEQYSLRRHSLAHCAHTAGDEHQPVQRACQPACVFSGPAGAAAFNGAEKTAPGTSTTRRPPAGSSATCNTFGPDDDRPKSTISCANDEVARTHGTRCPMARWPVPGIPHDGGGSWSNPADIEEWGLADARWVTWSAHGSGIKHRARKFGQSPPTRSAAPRRRPTRKSPVLVVVSVAEISNTPSRRASSSGSNRRADRRRSVLK